MRDLSAGYWNRLYADNQTGWDIGYPSPPICEYVDQLKDKTTRILVPGAGNAYEVEYLSKKGFTSVYLLDFSEKSIENFKDRCPGFPVDHIIKQNFFEHRGKYDLILEQTFFSAIHPSERVSYVKQVSNLLNSNGRLTGVLFGIEFDFAGPPFGGTKTEYSTLFSKFFEIEVLEEAYNSIKPRLGSELFIKCRCNTS